MPELPEVETVRRGLEPVLVGQRLSKVLVRRGDLRFPVPKDLANILTGRRVEALRRRAKYLLWDFDQGPGLLSHLGMSGRMTLVEDPKTPLETHDHLIFETESGQQVRYNDPRRFGFMDLIEDEAKHPRLINLGPEPLGNSFSGPYLYEALKGRKTAVKTAIMAQGTVVGVGNIYASEALFEARIRPTRLANKVSKIEAERLATSIKAVLARAIEAGGSSLNDFVQVSGELGYFQHDWRVYGRGGEPCRVCETPIQQLVLGQRSTFYCPNCQPK